MKGIGGRDVRYGEVVSNGLSVVHGLGFMEQPRRRERHLQIADPTCVVSPTALLVYD